MLDVASARSSGAFASTSTWSSGLAVPVSQGGDEVTQVFERLRIDMELTLRKQRFDMELVLQKHEAELRRSMESAKKQPAGEEAATDQNGQRSTSQQLAERNPANRSEAQANDEVLESREQSSMGSHQLAEKLTQVSINRRNLKISLSNHRAATRTKTLDLDKKTQANTRRSPWTTHLMKDGFEEGASSEPTAWERAMTSITYRRNTLLLPRLVQEDSRLHRLAKSTAYKFFWSLVIALDAVLVIAELSYASMKAQSSQYKGSIPDLLVFVIFTDVFCLYNLMDMLFQFILECPGFDIIKGRTGYRWFNIIVIIEQVLQVISQHARPDARSVSTFRIVVSQASFLRLIRPVLVLPEIAAKMELDVQELRVMVRSLLGAVQPLIWCATPLLLILANFGVFITEGVLVFLLNRDNSTYADIVSFFGTLDITMLSLYKSILGGMDWGDLYDVIKPLEWFLRYAFLVFICFNFIAMLNIVAAVFIKTAFVRFENDRQFLIQKELDEKQTYLETMQDVFAELDEDRDGMIFFKELEDHLGKPEVGAYFSRLGVDVNEVEKLFLLLDEDGSGCIDKNEFMFGCLRLKGEAKSLDLAILHREVQAIARDIVVMKGSNPAQPPVAPISSNPTDPAIFKILRQEVRAIGDHVKSLNEKLDDRTIACDSI